MSGFDAHGSRSCLGAQAFHFGVTGFASIGPPSFNQAASTTPLGFQPSLVIIRRKGPGSPTLAAAGVGNVGTQGIQRAALGRTIRPGWTVLMDLPDFKASEDSSSHRIQNGAVLMIFRSSTS